MTEKEIKFEILKRENRLAKLEGRPQNLDCPGVRKRLAREIRNLNKKLVLIDENVGSC